MKYDVLTSFSDDHDKAAQAGDNVYWAGKDLYPRDGYEPTAERLTYLQGSKNKFGKPVIANNSTGDTSKKAEPADKTKK